MLVVSMKANQFKLESKEDDIRLSIELNREAGFCSTLCEVVFVVGTNHSYCYEQFCTFLFLVDVDVTVLSK